MKKGLIGTIAKRILGKKQQQIMIELFEKCGFRVLGTPATEITWQ